MMVEWLEPFPRPIWIKLTDDSQYVEIFSNDNLLNGSYFFKIVTHVVEYDVYNDDLRFEVMFGCIIEAIVYNPYIDMVHYLISEPPN